MNNKKVLAVFFVHLVVLGIQAQNTSPVLYAPCENCNSGNHDENNHNFQYGDIREFYTKHVTSDFGPRNYKTYDWHGGVDYNPEGGDEGFEGILQEGVHATTGTKIRTGVDELCEGISNKVKSQFSFSGL